MLSFKMLLMVLLGLTTLAGCLTPTANSLEEIHQPPSQIRLPVGAIADKLENCQGISTASEEERNQYQFCAFDIQDNDLTKLRLLTPLYGEELCTYGRGEICEEELLAASVNVWRFSYETIEARRNCHTLSVWRTPADSFLLKLTTNAACSTPPSGIIYKIYGMDPRIVSLLQA